MVDRRRLNISQAIVQTCSAVSLPIPGLFPSPLFEGPSPSAFLPNPILAPPAKSMDSQQPLRFMCSYGGVIRPRPHDSSLRYIGGDTRIIVIHRRTSLSDLRHRLSTTFLHSLQSFSLKYLLPNQDLDTLISITTDEDLENMVEEHDWLNNAGGGPKLGRIRLFLFPEKSSNMEELLGETTSASTKSDDWVFNAINEKGSALAAATLDRGFSDSSCTSHLLGLDDDDNTLVGKTAKEAQVQIDEGRGIGSSNCNTVINHEVLGHSVPDSPMHETPSSFSSSSSSVSAANLRTIKLHVEENPKVGGLGIENRCQQQRVDEKQEASVAAERAVSRMPMVAAVGGEYAKRVISDDERSDHEGYRKAQQIHQHGQVQLLQSQQIQPKETAAFDLRNPYSISSEGNYITPLAMHQEQPITQIHSESTHQTDPPKNNIKVQMQLQAQDSGCALSGKYHQAHPQLHQGHRFVQPANQCIPIPTGAEPVAPYYLMHPSLQQHHQAFNQQHPVYLVPAAPMQPYNVPAVQQPSNSEPTPQAAPPAYTQTVDSYRTTPQFLHIPFSHHRAHYVGYTHIQLASQPMIPPLTANSNEFTHPSHAQAYYARRLQPQLAVLTSAPAVVVSNPALAQFPTENIKQQARTLQQ